MYYVARWYDPVLAHFTSADTIIPQPGNSGDWNRYAYVLYNPANFIDPSGHEICTEDGYCYDKGKYVGEYKTDKTRPIEYWLKSVFKSPVGNIQDDYTRFGEYRDKYFIGNHDIYHPGVDLGSQFGLPIYAVDDGTVVYAGYNIDFGYTVIIEHDIPYVGLVYSIYAHLGRKDMSQDKAIFVNENDWVTADTEIGVMGGTKGPKDNGEHIGPHLHFEVRTSLNVDLNPEMPNPVTRMPFWFNQDGGDTCNPWTTCWIDLGIIYGYSPSYEPEKANSE
jgi:murein DD-endopeptidase MepM/ murein hydrolase activator NlpD